MRESAQEGRTARSLLFPMSMIVMLGFACCRASSSQDARWLNVSRLHQGKRRVPVRERQRGGQGAEAQRTAQRLGKERKRFASAACRVACVRVSRGARAV